MRLTVLVLLLASVSGAAAAQVERARMPLEILRAQGADPRMGDVTLEAGGTAREDQFSFSVYFDTDGSSLGGVRSVSWSVNFDQYCRDRESWVQSILIGPGGQVWRGYRVTVPTGPDRQQFWSSGSSRATAPGAFATPGLVDAMEVGGVFTIGIEDDEGRRWSMSDIDTLDRQGRTRLFDANLAAVRAAPRDLPVKDQQLLQVSVPPGVTQPSVPRRCPTT